MVRGSRATRSRRSRGGTDVSVYHHLHAWVARLLLHRAQLHFAKDVLDNIPESAYEEDASGDRLLGKLRIHLTSLFEARRHRAILPVFISHEQWWITPPEGRICEASLGGKPIKHWYPGRIEYVANGDISISLGVPPEEGETEADIQTWDVSRQRFDELSGAETTISTRAGLSNWSTTATTKRRAFSCVRKKNMGCRRSFPIRCGTCAGRGP